MGGTIAEAVSCAYGKTWRKLWMSCLHVVSVMVVLLQVFMPTWKTTRLTSLLCGILCSQCRRSSIVASREHQVRLDHRVSNKDVGDARADLALCQLLMGGFASSSRWAAHGRESWRGPSQMEYWCCLVYTWIHQLPHERQCRPRCPYLPILLCFHPVPEVQQICWTWAQWWSQSFL